MKSEPRHTAGGILVRNSKVLLGKRREGRLYPGIWDIFGGHIEDDETREDAMRRELFEELGIEPVDYEFLESYDDTEPTYGLYYVHHIFMVYIWKGQPSNRIPEEHEKIGWFSKSEMRELDMHPEVRRIILENAEL
jgi:mutator protein MutT